MPGESAGSSPHCIGDLGPMSQTPDAHAIMIQQTPDKAYTVCQAQELEAIHSASLQGDAAMGRTPTETSLDCLFISPRRARLHSAVVPVRVAQPGARDGLRIDILVSRLGCCFCGFGSGLDLFEGLVTGIPVDHWH